MRDDIMRNIGFQRIYERVAKEEKYAIAFISETGLKPSECEMVIQQGKVFEEQIIYFRKRGAVSPEHQALLDRVNRPETEDFDKGVPLEAAHQVERWGTSNDDGKEPSDWFWLIGYLAGKALMAHIAGNVEKAKHHCISTAAALRNWHTHIKTGHSEMRPGIQEPE